MNSQTIFKIIGDRDEAIPVCFALGLTYEEACTYLNKTNQMIFNIRDPYDAIYMYCLKNHRPLSAAWKLFKEYENANVSLDSNASKSHIEKDGSGLATHTTLFLKNQLGEDASWDSDEQFLNTFLLPNKHNFIFYSKTALREYYHLKISTSLYSLKYIDTEPIIRNKIFKKMTKGNRDFEGHCPILDRALCNVGKNTYDFTKMTESLDRSFRDFLREGFDPSNPLSAEAYDFALESLNKYMGAILTAEDMLHPYLPSVYISPEMRGSFVKIDGKEHQITAEEEENQTYDPKDIYTKDNRVLKKSRKYSGNVLYLFFNKDQYLYLHEKPESKSHLLELRKTIILLYFFQYAVEFIHLRDGEPLTDKEDYSLGDFMEQLNHLLSECQMGSLYPGIHLDYLILRSIRHIEKDYTGCQGESDLEDNPSLVPYFHRVIALSYESE